MKKLLIIAIAFLASQMDAQISSYGNYGGWIFESKHNYNHRTGERNNGAVEMYWNRNGGNIFEIHYANGYLDRYYISQEYPTYWTTGYTKDGDYYDAFYLRSLNNGKMLRIQVVKNRNPYIRLHYKEGPIDFYDY